MAKRRAYTLEFKQEAVRLVLEQGLTQTRVARDLGVHKTVIRDWVHKARAGELGGATAAASSSALEEENRRLRRELAIVREEREILKNAAVNSIRQRNTSENASLGQL